MKAGITRYIGAIKMVQRGARARRVMWDARSELVETQWDRVEEMMLAQRERALKGLPMSFRRKAVLRRIPRIINDRLAEAKVTGPVLVIN